jgi:hypothetical protein
LIGGNEPLPPVKLRKCGGEGNFVKLKMNRSSKHKFVNKGSGRNSYASSGRKSYRRGRRRLRPEGGTEGENSVREEDGLVVESAGQMQRKHFSPSGSWACLRTTTATRGQRVYR